MAPQRLSPPDLRTAFPAGTVVHNPVSGEHARVVERSLATVAPIARRRGRSVTRDVMRGAIVAPERWPAGRTG